MKAHALHITPLLFMNEVVTAASCVDTSVHLHILQVRQNKDLSKMKYWHLYKYIVFLYEHNRNV